jgi:hypothetical protein
MSVYVNNFSVHFLHRNALQIVVREGRMNVIFLCHLFFFITTLDPADSPRELYYTEVARKALDITSLSLFLFVQEIMIT